MFALGPRRSGCCAVGNHIGSVTVGPLWLLFNLHFKCGNNHRIFRSHSGTCWWIEISLQFGFLSKLLCHHMAMGQSPNRTPSEHQPIPTKIPKQQMGGEFTHPNQNGINQNGFDSHLVLNLSIAGSAGSARRDPLFRCRFPGLQHHLPRGGDICHQQMATGL